MDSDNSANETKTEPVKDDKAEIRAYLSSVGHMFLALMDETVAPNYMEFPLKDKDGKELVVITVRRPTGVNANELLAREREVTAKLQACLDTVASAINNTVDRL